MATMLILLLLPAAILLSAEAEAGEIIGGWEAKPHSRPYMAYLKIKRGKKGVSCGGFLVSENFVLTAAHCNGNHISVYLGAHNIKKKERTQQRISARCRIPHPEYKKKTYNNDIMLLQLAQRAKLNKWVDTIALPRANVTVKPGTKCSIAGWGRTGFRPKPTKLQEVDVQVLKDYACLKNPINTYRYYNTSTMMCVGDPEKGKGSWKGDSGGPLVCKGTAQGIVSFGPNNGSPPRMFARVSPFIPWIKATMKKLQV